MPPMTALDRLEGCGLITSACVGCVVIAAIVMFIIVLIAR